MEKPAELMLEHAELYKDFIAKARKLGATKRSYNSLRQEYHEYAQTYPLPNLAVELCMQSFTLTAQEQVEKKAKPEFVLKAGRLCERVGTTKPARATPMSFSANNKDSQGTPHSPSSCNCHT